jgi:hypothetical protein
MLAGLHRAAISATQAINLAFLTYVGVFRFRPCIAGEFMGKAPKFENRFIKATEQRGFDKTAWGLRY